MFSSIWHSRTQRILRLVGLISILWLLAVPLDRSPQNPIEQLGDEPSKIIPGPDPTPTTETSTAPVLQVAPITHAPRRFIFIKTHKTGSTTLGSIFFRYAVRHNLKIFVPPDHYSTFSDFEPTTLASTNNQNSDIFLNHFSPEGDPIFRNNNNNNNNNETHHFTTESLISMYRRAVPKALAITVLREPHARFISHFFYLVRPSRPDLTLDDYARTRRVFPAAGWTTNWNRQSQDLGISTRGDLDRFLQSDKDRYFGMILVTELFDASLVLMRRKFGWARADVAYLRMLDSCTDGRRWDNRRVECSAETVRRVMTEPGFEKTRALVEKANELDKVLYEAVRRELEMELELQGEEFWEEVEELKATVKRLKESCVSFAGMNSKVEMGLYRWTQGVVREMRLVKERLEAMEVQRLPIQGGDEVDETQSVPGEPKEETDVLTSEEQAGLEELEAGVDGNDDVGISEQDRDMLNVEWPFVHKVGESFADLVPYSPTDREKVEKRDKGGARLADPYPCFPYSIPDMHYEYLARIGRGRVSYLPGLVPRTEDETWIQYAEGQICERKRARSETIQHHWNKSNETMKQLRAVAASMPRRQSGTESQSLDAKEKEPAVLARFVRENREGLRRDIFKWRAAGWSSITGFWELEFRNAAKDAFVSNSFPGTHNEMVSNRLTFVEVLHDTKIVPNCSSLRYTLPRVHARSGLPTFRVYVSSMGSVLVPAMDLIDVDMVRHKWVEWEPGTPQGHLCDSTLDAALRRAPASKQLSFVLSEKCK
ncbi:galactose-3-O-sulfotransferase-domain-containing protein [Cladochytrium replicatum]|nr:galactose-3-O-sulfotransferase-domain-containing protein [Cladochytrium replicatum]